MDKAETLALIETLQNAQSIVGSYRSADSNIPAYDLEILGTAYSLYKKNYESWTGRTTDPRILDVRTFHKYVDPEVEIGALISHLYQSLKRETQTSHEVKKEETSIPPELEALVAEYEEFKSKQHDNDGKANSVADSIKRAREAMIIRERLSAIRRNRAALSDNPETFNQSEDKRYEDLITQICNPKAKDEKGLFEPVENTLTEAVHSYIDQRTDITASQKQELSELTPEIVKNAQYLYLTGALNISNHNDLIVGVEVALHLTSPQVNTPITLIYQELVNQEKEIDSIRRNISFEELKISELETKLKRVSSKEELNQTLEEITSIQSNINKLNGQIQSIPTKLTQSVLNKSNQIESHLESQVEGTINNNNVIKYVKNAEGNYVPAKNEDGSLVINRDFTDSLSDKAGKTISTVQEKLLDSNIQRKLPSTPDQLNGVENIERAIRKNLPDIGLSPNATNEASQVAALLSDSKSQNPDLSAHAVLLFGKGMTSKKLDEAIEHAKNNPDSDIGRLLKANPELFGKLRHQLSDIEQTTSEQSTIERSIQYAKDNPNSILGQLYSQNKQAFDSYVKLSEKLNYRQILNYAKSNPDSTIGKFLQTNSKILGKANQELNKIKNSALAREIGKPINAVGKIYTGVQNRITSLSSRVAPYVNFIFDPVGSIRSYLGRKAGEYILKKVVSVVSKETGELILKQGLKGAVKELTKQAAKRLAVEAAKLAAKTGVKVSLEAAAQAANVVPGLGIILAIAIEVLWTLAEVTIGVVKRTLNTLSLALYGEEYNFKTVARDTATVIGGIAVAGFTFVAGVATAIIASAAAAAASATGILVLSTAAGFFLYVTSVVVGPLISTLVQLEAQQSLSVSGECTWPVHGGYTVCQGPLGVFSHKNGVQGIDICGTSKNTVHAIAEGVVTFAGNRGDIYGNLLIINVTTSAGTFDVWYGHLTDFSVGIGDTVRQDQIVGITGNTGDTGDPNWTMSDHVHMEYRGIKYNDCPSGGIPVPEGCSNNTAGAENCTFNGDPILTD